MPTSPTLWIFTLGSMIFFGASLALIYRGRKGSESSLRRGTDMAGWALTIMTGIYMGFAIANDAHSFSKIEMFFNGVLVTILVIMRWQNVSQRLAFASLLIGVHGLWDVLHLFDLPLANDLVPKWYAGACGILDLVYFAIALPVFINIVRTGRANSGEPAS